MQRVAPIIVRLSLTAFGTTGFGTVEETLRGQFTPGRESHLGTWITDDGQNVVLQLVPKNEDPRKVEVVKVDGYKLGEDIVLTNTELGQQIYLSAANIDEAILDGPLPMLAKGLIATGIVTNEIDTRGFQSFDDDRRLYVAMVTEDGDIGKFKPAVYDDGVPAMLMQPFGRTFVALTTTGLRTKDGDKIVSFDAGYGTPVSMTAGAGTEIISVVFQKDGKFIAKHYDGETGTELFLSFTNETGQGIEEPLPVRIDDEAYGGRGYALLQTTNGYQTGGYTRVSA